jgi:hypothetical protein
MRIEQLDELIAGWHKSLCPQIDLAGLIARNNTAHKWKVTYRSIVLRELVLWRFTDLIAQAANLIRGRHILGARILIRSGIETLAILIYLNQRMNAVIAGTVDFFDFAAMTNRLMLGSRNQTTRHEAINILSVLEKCDRQYPGILKVYGDLSESAHPNYDGVTAGYSVIDEKEFRTDFKNRWSEQSGESELELLEICVRTFEEEYNEVWPRHFENFEHWLVANDASLEAQKVTGRGDR